MAPPANTTSIYLMAPEQPLPLQRTYVCIGLERGGTSAVAGIMRALGLPMGEGMAGNNEDPDFQAKTLSALRSAIEERNQRYDVWGWKFPTAVQQLPALVESLRNPYFVVVFRDVVATALSRNKWDGPNLRRRMELAAHEANAWTNMNLGFILAARRPALLVSHEKLLTNHGALVDELADMLGVDRPDGEFRDRLIAYLAPGQYKSFEEFFGGPVVAEPTETESSL
jgi:hypothetical protein